VVWFPTFDADNHVKRQSPPPSPAARPASRLLRRPKIKDLFGRQGLRLDLVPFQRVLIRDLLVLEQHGCGVVPMNRFLLLVTCAFVGILVSSCAQNPHCVVPEPTYGSPPGGYGSPPGGYGSPPGDPRYGPPPSGS
jgi:hypothetical protein